MKCKCGSDLEILAEGGRYTRFGYFPSRSYQCPNCEAIYEMDGPHLVEVHSSEQKEAEGNE